MGQNESSGGRSTVSSIANNQHTGKGEEMTKRLNNKQVRQAISNREEFTNSTRSMHAEMMPSQFVSRGKLNNEEYARLCEDMEKGITYIVYSYETPIYWEDSHREYSYRVSQRFSVTSSKHVGMCPLPKN